MRSLARAAAVLGAMLTAGSVAQANPLDMYGFGARSMALAGAVTADVGDVSANYYNPAGLTHLPGLRAELGYLYARPFLRTDGRDNGADPSHGVVGGIAAPGRLFGLRFAFGLGVHIPDQRVSQVRALPATQPRWELYSVRLQRIYVAASLAIAPTRWLRLGGGMVFMASTRGGIDVAGRISAVSPASSELSHVVDADLQAVRYPQFGAQVDIGRYFSAGLVFRDEFRLDTRLDAGLRGQIIVGSIDDPRALMIPGSYQLRSQTLTAFQPRQVSLGLSWHPSERLRVLADVTWVQWSRYENPTSALDVSLDLRIPAGIPGLRQPAVPIPAAREAMRFTDTFVPRVGAEYVAPLGRHALSLRAGYHLDLSPVPDQPGVTNFMDSTRHVVALGAGIALRRLGRVFPGTLSLDVGGSLQVLAPRTVVKLDPNDPVGDYRLSGTVLTVVSTLSLGFE